MTGFTLQIQCFNPRLTSAARRTSALRASYASVEVSIRASLQQRGEHRVCRFLPLHLFQSAPHFSSEANLPCFPVRRRPGVSIRASLQQRGELSDGEPDYGSQQVSIRASLQQRGERGSESVESGET